MNYILLACILICGVGVAIYILNWKKNRTRKWIHSFLEDKVYLEEDQIVGFSIKRKRELDGWDFIVTVKVLLALGDGDIEEEVETHIISDNTLFDFQQWYRYDQKIQKLERKNLKKIH